MIAKLRREVRATSTYSTAAALHQALFDNANTLKCLPAARTEGCRILTNAEYDQTIAELRTIKPYSFDAKDWQLGDTLRDEYGHRFRVARRKLPVRGFEFVVWSVGPDGLSGTDDDVVSPYGEHPPDSASRAGTSKNTDPSRPLHDLR
jgi:hypothetical protein